MASLGIEICENADGDRSAAEDRAARLVAWLLRTEASIEGIRQHYDWTGKNCPRVLRSRPGGWTGFLAAVDRYGEGSDIQMPKPEPWKVEAIDYFASRGMLNQPDLWKEIVDEPLPSWASFIMLKRVHRQVEYLRREMVLLTRDQDRRFS